MAQHITTNAVEAIRILNPVLEVAAEHVRLLRCGSQFRGLCPFHEEKSPSLYVNPDKQVFRCHGCGTGGDVFTFIMRLHSCSFPQAVTTLAVRAGLNLDRFEASPELAAKVAGIKADREEQTQFERFCNSRIEGINQRYRSLARAATNAEACLRSGKLDPCEQEMAWSALERYRIFAASVEREGLCDLEILKTEWSKLHDAA